MKKGFTLVELSIVLVIIGLLIGGILVGQSLIDSAKVNSQISQIQQFDIAVRLFKDKFRSLPGDSTIFPNEGNGDRLIMDSDFAEPFDFSGEISNFWAHLSSGGFKPEKKLYTNALSSGEITNDNIPEAVYNDDAGVAAMRHIDSGGNVMNVFVLANFFGTTNNGDVDNPGNSPAYPQGAFTALEILAFEQKLDGGTDQLGDIQSWQQGDLSPDPCSYSAEDIESDIAGCKIYWKMEAFSN